MMFKRFLLPLVILTSCTTTTKSNPTTLVEPKRSMFMVQCVAQGGFTITDCLCHEKILVDIYGIDPTQVDIQEKKTMQRLILECDYSPEGSLKQYAPAKQSPQEELEEFELPGEIRG